MASAPRIVTNTLSSPLRLLDVVGYDGLPIVLQPGVATDLLQSASEVDLAKSRHLSRLQTLGVITVDASLNSVPCRLLYSNMTPVATGAGTTEQTLMSYTLPAGTLTPGRSVKVTAFGVTAANTNNKTVKLTFGATGITTPAMAAANNTPWRLSAVVSYGASASAQIGSSDGGAWNGSALGQPTQTSPTENSAADIVIAMKATDAVNSAGDITCRGMIVELLS